MTTPHDNPFLQIVTTTDSQESAARLASALIERRLAACVQVQGPIQSTYRWQGAVESSTEWVCTMKTSRAKFPELRTAIEELHSYDVPEIVATEIVDGSEAYLGWLADSLADSLGEEPE